MLPGTTPSAFRPSRCDARVAHQAHRQDRGQGSPQGGEARRRHRRHGARVAAAPRHRSRHQEARAPEPGRHGRRRPGPVLHRRAARVRVPGASRMARPARPPSCRPSKRAAPRPSTVSDDVVAAAVQRDTYTATSAAEMRRVALRRRLPLVQRPVGRADFLANPPYPNFDLNQVVAVAKQYQGVPYRYGGADPAGFDCSGFTQYVYAQFGVSLPHSSSRRRAPAARAITPVGRPARRPRRHGRRRPRRHLPRRQHDDRRAAPRHRRRRSARSTTRPLVRPLRHLSRWSSSRERGVSSRTRVLTCRCTAVTASRATLKSSDTENLRREPCESRAASSPWMHARSSA